MKVSHSLLLTGATVAIIGGVSLYTASTTALAAEESTAPMSSLVEKISSRFGLNQDEVQTVVDEEREIRRQAHRAAHTERLQSLVDEGTITQAQRALIESKHAEIVASRENRSDEWRSLSPDEKRAQMEQEREQFQSWAEENGIDPQYLMMGTMAGKGQGRQGFGQGMRYQQ